MLKRILVVGEDPVLVRELRSEGRTQTSEWEFQCVRTGLEALAALAQENHTAVVANWRLPGGMSGSALLDEVLRRRPGCLRFVRTELTDSKGTMRCVGSAHRLLIQAMTVQTLKEAVQDALGLETWLPTERVRTVLGACPRIPSPPEMYFEVVAQLQSATASLEEIGETISRDPALTAKLLQLVNSAVFALQFRVSHPGEAVAYLGLDTTRSLVLLAHSFSHFDDLVMPGFSIEGLWEHSYSVARCARAIAQAESSDPEEVAQAFTGGLLHDFGKLVLAANEPDRFQQAIQRAGESRSEMWSAELHVLGTHHGEVGACLLAAWGLPAPIIAAVGLHHRPVRMSEAEFTPLVAVHAANILAQSIDLNRHHLAAPSFDLEFLLHSGCADRVPSWTELCVDVLGPIREAVGL